MSAKMTLSCDEHGMPSASSSVTSMRSLRVSMMRAVSVAIVSQPRPSTIGRTALPFSPMPRSTRLDMTASRGRYPESSSIEKTKKNVVTTGRTMATA